MRSIFPFDNFTIQAVINSKNPVDFNTPTMIIIPISNPKVLKSTYSPTFSTVSSADTLSSNMVIPAAKANTERGYLP
jgi:hypothetical protein